MRTGIPDRIREYGRSVMGLPKMTRETQASLPEPPLTVPLAWELQDAAEDRLERALQAADECAKACTGALPGFRGRERTSLASIAGVCGFVAEQRISSDPELLLGLCVRVIESNAATLDGLGSDQTSVLAASAARRCVQSCRQALVSWYCSRA